MTTITADDVIVMAAQTTESLATVVTTSADPTATPPTFALIDALSAPTGATTWVAGEWSGAWTAGTVGALTPLIGAGGEPGFTLAAGSRVRVWLRYTAGGESPTEPIGSIRVLAATPALGTWPVLATLNDLEARLGAPLGEPTRAAAVLTDVSAVLHFESGYTLTETTPMVTALACHVAARAYVTPPSAAGVRQETVGSYSYSLSADAGGGAFTLTESELRIVQSLRGPMAPIAMSAPYLTAVECGWPWDSML